MTDAQIIARITELQEIQKRNHPRSVAWEEASAKLAPLFAEMARRQGARS